MNDVLLFIARRARCTNIHKLWNLGWGLLNQFPTFRYFPIFSAIQKHWLPIKHHVHIRQMSSQLSGGDTCQMWMGFKESKMFFSWSKFSPPEKLTNGALIPPPPRLGCWCDNPATSNVKWTRLMSNFMFMFYVLLVFIKVCWVSSKCCSEGVDIAHLSLIIYRILAFNCLRKNLFSTGELS